MQVKHSLGVLATLLLWVATPLAADEASHRAAAEELLVSTNMERMQEQVLGTMRHSMEAQFRAVKFPDEVKPHFEKVLPQFLDEMVELTAQALEWNAMKDSYIDIYVAAFTEDEIRDLTAFYQTPLGQKMLTKMPALMQRSMQLSQERMATMQPQLMDIVKRMTEAVRAEQEAAEAQKAPQ